LAGQVYVDPASDGWIVAEDFDNVSAALPPLMQFKLCAEGEVWQQAEGRD